MLVAATKRHRFLRAFRYVIAQEVLDRRHVGNTSPAMEHTGMHACLQHLHDVGVPVHELTTDEHSQVVADFSK